MDDLRFNVLFNKISVISGRWYWLIMKGCVQWNSVYGIKQNIAELSGSNVDGSFTAATSFELVLESLTKTKSHS